MIYRHYTQLFAIVNISFKEGYLNAKAQRRKRGNQIWSAVTCHRFFENTYDGSTY